MSQPLVRVHVHGATGSIILNRPDKRNALSRALLAEISQAFDDLHQERRVRGVVLTGAGPSFCAGMDLDEMLATSQEPDAHARWSDDVLAYRDLVEKMLQFPKPIVAAVNGAAVAGGLGLVAACDLVLAADDARFGLPEPRRGITAAIVAPLVVFRIGAGQAAYLLMTGAIVDVTRAERMGLVHERTASAQLWPRAVELVEECARCAPSSLQLTKRMLNETIGEQLSSMLSTGAAVSATARTTEAAAEGLAAFREKRPPQW
ncbi:MAG: enoyl-CoA hydratase/isomerase family protein [Pirellulales bacterium]|nr:enoyl-CoA hydratase/isomerase family protein [Pirellulales bacterium]